MDDAFEYLKDATEGAGSVGHWGIGACFGGCLVDIVNLYFLSDLDEHMVFLSIMCAS